MHELNTKTMERVKPPAVTAETVTIEGVCYQLDREDGRTVWLNQVPSCACGEPLVLGSERPMGNRLVPTQEVSFIAGFFFIQCEACGKQFDLDGSDCPRCGSSEYANQECKYCHCPKCGGKGHIDSNTCSTCGRKDLPWE
jgi:hypothetical protein